MLFVNLFKELLDKVDISLRDGDLKIQFNIFDELEIEIRLKNRIIIDV